MRGLPARVPDYAEEYYGDTGGGEAGFDLNGYLG
jgi:hypothetical protein